MNIDHFILGLDGFFRTVFPPANRSSSRINPAQDIPAPLLNPNEQRHVAGLMRVNHAGEVCAQALYLGQALTAQQNIIQDQMKAAAKEEIDHLAWCEQRLKELSAQPSALNGFWYIGSFMLGIIAGFVGDRWSLGFVAETERQVSAHLKHHIDQLSAEDIKTRAILTQMSCDEKQHALDAEKAGGLTLPWLIRQGMCIVSKVMTKSSYYF
jgi:ubiquinone biosynthesis monooxygenase Coq7